MRSIICSNQKFKFTKNRPKAVLKTQNKKRLARLFLIL